MSTESREISCADITDAVAKMCVEANYRMLPDVRVALETARGRETNETAIDVIGDIIQNADIASQGVLPLCQDNGIAVIFAEVGQDVRIVGGSFRKAIDEGVRRGYEEGYLRKSVVRDPIDRTNTRDNTPCVLYTDIVSGSRLKLLFMPKGAGSENKSSLTMLDPSAGLEGVKHCVVESVRRAGPDPCPPIIVGVGVGGTADLACVLAKRALSRTVGAPSFDGRWAQVERELLDEINALDIGPAGLGGATTALAVHIETYATHIASLPVAVCIGCHSTRHAEAML